MPATTTPGIAAAVPVPSLTTASIICCSSEATWGVVTRTNRGLASASSVGIGRRPPSAIVAATSVIVSGVACTRPWPIADGPSSASLSRLLGGTDGSSAPGIEDGWLKPNRSAVCRNRLAPTLTPSGANTELHETANALSSVPPQSSPPAFCSV